MRNLGAVASATRRRSNAYLFLLTDRYPYAAPAVRDRPRDEQLVLDLARCDGHSGNRAGLKPLLLRLSLVGAAAVAWLVCASLLLHTAVPGGLRLAAVDADAVFGQAARAARPNTSSGSSWSRGCSGRSCCSRRSGSTPAAGRASPASRRQGRSAPGCCSGCSGSGSSGSSSSRSGSLDLWWARRHDLTEAGYLDWAFGHWFELGGDVRRRSASPCSSSCSSPGGSARAGGSRVPPCSSSIGAAFAFVQPYLVTETTPLRGPCSAPTAEAFERKQGVSGIPVSVEDVSGTTSQANAYAVGFGPSRKVVLWSTMVDGTFADAEVRVVLAHEIGHHSSNHIPKALAWFALFALPGAWILMRVTRRRGGMGEAAAVPLALLVVAVIQLGTRAGAGTGSAAGWKPRRTGRRCRRRAIPAAARGAVRRLRQDVTRRTPIRRPGLTCSSTATRRSPSASRWRGLGGASGRSGARQARRDAPTRPSRIAPTSACTRGRSRPRAASAGRRGR